MYFDSAYGPAVLNLNNSVAPPGPAPPRPPRLARAVISHPLIPGLVGDEADGELQWAFPATRGATQRLRSAPLGSARRTTLLCAHLTAGSVQREDGKFGIEKGAREKRGGGGGEVSGTENALSLVGRL